MRKASTKEEVFAEKLSPTLLEKTGAIGSLFFGKSGCFQWFFANKWKQKMWQDEKNRFLSGMASHLLPSMGCYVDDKVGISANAVWREDFDNVAYLLWRDNTNDVRVQAFEKDVFDAHLENAAKGIRIENAKGEALFTIADGDEIRFIHHETGNIMDYKIRYVDDTTFETNEKGFDGGPLSQYTTAEVAAWIPKHYKVIPLRRSLPEKCYVLARDAGEPGIFLIHRGVGGMVRCCISSTEDPMVIRDNLNSLLGNVTAAQTAAMLAGSVRGWDSVYADPANYEEDGTLKF